MDQKQPTRILIVEDEIVVAVDIQEMLESLGYEVLAIVDSGEEALAVLNKEVLPHLIMMDIILAGELNGVQTADKIRNRFDIPVIYLTANADDKTLQSAIKTQPYGYLLKPFEDRELHSGIEMGLYRHKLEREIRESRKWFATTLKSIGDGVIATDAKGLVVFMNPIAENLTGWQEKDAVGKKLIEVFNIVSEETRSVVDNPAIRAMSENRIATLANHTMLVAKDGSERPIDDSAAPIHDDNGKVTGAVLVFRDVTERKLAENKLRQSLKDKEVLLQEIHHRVKNNLQIISSLLMLQSENLNDQKALDIFTECQNRIKSIGLIHEYLYKSHDLARIDFAEYIQGLTTHLLTLYKGHSTTIKIKTDINDTPLDIDIAIPCGLIINELLSNAMKHAFPQKEKGEIYIYVLKDDENHYTLIVKDNGIGFPQGLNYQNPDSLGLKLVHSLTRQFKGTIDMNLDGGTEFRIGIFFQNSSKR